MYLGHSFSFTEGLEYELINQFLSFDACAALLVFPLFRGTREESPFVVSFAPICPWTPMQLLFDVANQKLFVS